MGLSVGLSADVSVGLYVGVSVGVSVDLPADVSVGLSADVSVDVSVHKSVGVAVGISVVPRLAVVCRGCLPWLAVEIAVDLAVEIAVEIAMSSAVGLHSVQLLAAAFRGSPWNPWKPVDSPWIARGVFAVARGMSWKHPWNAVEAHEHCRGPPPTRQILYIPPSPPPHRLLTDYTSPSSYSTEV